MGRVLIVRKSGYLILCLFLAFSLGCDTQKLGGLFGGSEESAPQEDKVVEPIYSNVEVSGSAVEMVQLSTSERQISPSANLIGLWHLNEETASDNQGLSDESGINLAVLHTSDGSTNKSIAGHIGHAIGFDGGDDYIEIPDSNNLDLGGDFTIWAWINPTSFGGGSLGRIIDHDGGGSSNGWNFFLDNSGGGQYLKFRINNGSAPNLVTSEVNAIALDTWTQVGVTYSSGTIKLWVNGGISGQQTGAAAVVANANPIRIGMLASSALNNFDGQIDEVAIWNRALTDQEIADLFKLQHGSYGRSEEPYLISTPVGTKDVTTTWAIFSPVPEAPYFKELVSDLGENLNYSSDGIDTTGLVGYWNLNGATGSLADGVVFTDLSGNGNDGIASNGGSASILRGTGLLNEAVYFDGVNDTIQVPTSATLEIDTNITLTGWAKPTEFQSSWRCIVGKGRWNYWLQISGSGVNMRPVIGMNSNPSGTEAQSSVPIPIDKWSFVVGTYDGVKTRIYVNGVLTGEKALTGPIATSSSNLTIGSADDTEYMTGWIDEVSVWNRALSDSEIMALYKRGVMNLKYQVRTCNSRDCSDGADFVGPGGSTSSYFSELSNSTSSLPVFDLSGFTTPSQYIQYKAIYETTDSRFTPKLKSGTFQ